MSPLASRAMGDVPELALLAAKKEEPERGVCAYGQGESGVGERFRVGWDPSRIDSDSRLSFLRLEFTVKRKRRNTTRSVVPPFNLFKDDRNTYISSLTALGPLHEFKLYLPEVLIIRDIYGQLPLGSHPWSTPPGPQPTVIVSDLQSSSDSTGSRSSFRDSPWYGQMIGHPLDSRGFYRSFCRVPVPGDLSRSNSTVAPWVEKFWKNPLLFAGWRDYFAAPGEPVIAISSVGSLSVGSTLEAARARWSANSTKPKKGKEAIASWYGEKDLDVDHDISQIPAGPPTVNQAIPEAPVPETFGRGFRVIKPVERYGADFEATSTMMFHFVPEPPPSSEEAPTAAGIPSQAGTADVTLDVKKREGILEEGAWGSTQKNEFGLWKRYWTVERRPHDPESHISQVDVLDSHPVGEELDPQVHSRQKGRRADNNRFYPFPNLSSYLLGQWFWNDQGKSRESLQQLVEIITSEGFQPLDLLYANWNKIQTSLTSSEFEDSSETMWEDDGGSWETASVTIAVPFNSTSLQPGAHYFTVEGFRYRPLVSVLRAKLQDPEQTAHFHFVPYDLRWQPPGSGADSRIYGEMYHSQAFLDAYREIQASSLPPEPEEDHLPRYVVGLMFASDQTMLASFGDAKLWPVYMLYGNESKYRRSKVSLGLFEEIAYFKTLPDQFADWYIRLSGKNLIMTYSADYPESRYQDPGPDPCCKCLVSLDEIQNMGLPSDLQVRVSRRRVDGLERQAQVAKVRQLIYRGKHLSVNSKPVEAILKPTSLVPTQNAFSEKLLVHGFNVYDLAAPDILHEVEIGVWKSLFLHLLRILEVEDSALTNILDRRLPRYRQVPTFGRDTIRRFSNSVSLLKQLAARDYEDMLQCAFPVFEGLLPEDHGVRVQKLLFTLGHWHGLAKLRMHTEFTLEILDQWTPILGEDARSFVESTCAEYETRELKREYESRKRAQARRPKKGSGLTPRPSEAPVPIIVGTTPADAPSSENAITAQGDTAAPSSETFDPVDRLYLNSSLSESKAAGKGRRSKAPAGPATAESTTQKDVPGEAGEAGDGDGDGRKPRTWNINTPKFHALGDVAPYIRRFGTTDSYSTQLSERFHRVSKSRYKKTNKKDIHRQLSRLQSRQTRLRKLRRQIDPSPEELDGPSNNAPHNSDARWYFIGKSQNQPVNLTHFVRVNANDWAGFLPRLKFHLFPRVIARLLQEAQTNPEVYGQSIPPLSKLFNSFSEGDLINLHFHSDRIYRHSVFKLRFTTYDCRADEDTFNPSTSRRDFMCLRGTLDSGGTPDSEEEDRYRYGRILGIFHANILYSGPGALDTYRRRFDFLWVRWFIPREKSRSWLDKSHDVVSFPPAGSPLVSCDFLDPLEVLRGAHIVPRFATGPAHDPESEAVQHQSRIFSKCAQDYSDWNQYFVNRFVDRDMIMRFHPGLTPGHASSKPPVPVPAEDTPMEWNSEYPRFGESEEDAQMAVDSATDSDDSEYDPLPLPGRLSDEEDMGDQENALSDIGEPDSEVENPDIFQ
ncbi:hypothetical protein NMY22_g15195 [Coprinellus aureogranulatus]|nr:hypothetical protein NMY22_g15195 [Coprinellus aureogranulatus]